MRPVEGWSNIHSRTILSIPFGTWKTSFGRPFSRQSLPTLPRSATASEPAYRPLRANCTAAYPPAAVPALRRIPATATPGTLPSLASRSIASLLVTHPIAVQVLTMIHDFARPATSSEEPKRRLTAVCRVAPFPHAPTRACSTLLPDVGYRRRIDKPDSTPARS